jgi:glutamyl-tRNA synthetase
LGYDTEKMQYAHMPMILNKDRSKMSKRKDPVSVTHDFKEKGYLPSAMFNFMALLGWSPKNNQEVLSVEEIINVFDIKDIGKSPAIFEIDKLDWLNGHYIRQMSIDDLYEMSKSYLLFEPCLPDFDEFNRVAGRQSRKLPVDQVKKILTTIKDRLKRLSDIKELSGFYFEISDYKKEQLVFSPKGGSTSGGKNSDLTSTQKGLSESCRALEDVSDDAWESVEELNSILLDVVQKNNLKNGDVFWPVRVALSGLDQSPSPTEILWVLGKEESLKRVRKGIELLRD